MRERREFYRKGLSDLYLPYYDALCDELSDDWQPTQGVRSFEDQERLYVQNIHVTNAKAGESAHNYGCASDWVRVVDGSFYWGLDIGVWEPYFQALEKLGLKNLKAQGDFPHNELLLNRSWKDILEAYNQGGMDNAYDLIRDSIVT